MQSFPAQGGQMMAMQPCAMPNGGNMQGGPGYFFCMVPVPMQAQNSTSTMQQEGPTGQNMQQMWNGQTPQKKSPGGKAGKKQDARADMKGFGGDMQNVQMMQAPGGMMWVAPQHQGFQQWNGMNGQQGSNSTWNQSAASFIPQSQNATAPVDHTAPLSPRKKTSDEKPVAEARKEAPERKTRTLLKNARLDKTGAPILPTKTGAANDIPSGNKAEISSTSDLILNVEDGKQTEDTQQVLAEAEFPSLLSLSPKPKRSAAKKLINVPEQKLNGTAWGRKANDEEASPVLKSADKLQKQAQDDREAADTEAGEDAEDDGIETSEDESSGASIGSKSDYIVFPQFFLYRFIEEPAPQEIQSFKASEHELAWRPAVEKSAEPSDRAMFGSRRPQESLQSPRKWDRKEPENLSKLGNKAENAYKMAQKDDLDRIQELERCAKSLLNKICPENVEKIACRIKDEAGVTTITEMEYVIALIFKKALAEPHYCETYATMVSLLKNQMPSFPNPAGGKDITFKTILLNVCQAEFESMPKTLQQSEEEIASLDKEELEEKKLKQKARLLANMKFIGHLYLQQLLTTRIVGTVMCDLIGTSKSDEVPEEHAVECTIELFSAIGYTLETQPLGKDAVAFVCGRLYELKQSKNKEGKGVLSKRIQFCIQDVLEMQAAGWARKTFKNTAKTKEEIRRDAEAQAHSKDGSGAEYVIAGARKADMAPKALSPLDEWRQMKSRKGNQ